MNKDLLQAILDQETTKTETPKPKIDKPKIMIIGDSNIQRTKHHLNREKATWTISNQIFRVSELAQATQKEDLINAAREHDKIIIHLGTNDLRGHPKEAEVHESLMKSARTIQTKTQKPVIISEIPPMKIPHKPEYTVKTAIYNTRTNNTNEQNITPLQITQDYKMHPYDEILENDGFHLKEQGQMILKQKLEEAATTTTTTAPPQPSTSSTPETTTRKPPNPDIKTINIKTTPELVKHIVGKQGTTVKKLQETHNARISISNDGNSSTIQIKAPHEDAQKAQKAISDILSSKANRKVCEYFPRGPCRYGDKCKNEHQSNPQKRPRTKSPAQKTRTPRTQSKSPPRKHRENPFSVLE